jgi:ribosomal protein S18 acetylase RimI-like enzyme
MTPAVAEQIAHLLNTQNQLTVPYTAAKVLKHHDRYLIRLDAAGRVLGAVEVKKVQWYQCEIDHLSVHPEARGQGIGKSLLQEAEAAARRLGARIAQCTIRVGNVQSEGLFKKHGYSATVTFFNQQNDNRVTVYQKVLVPVPQGTAE